MAEYIEKATLLNRVIIPSICSCVQGPTAERLKKFCMEAVKNVSAADVAPVVHGSWDGTADGYADGELVYDMWSCSVCGFDADGADEKPTWKYCPNCGAKMDGEETHDR